MTTEPEQPAPPALEPVEPGYKSVLRVRFLIFWLAVWAAATVFDRILLKETEFTGFPTVAVFVIAAAGVLTAPQRIYARLHYRLTEKLLQVVRGWLFHVDTVVPLVRVQHIDVTRGPLEKCSAWRPWSCTRPEPITAS